MSTENILVNRARLAIAAVAPSTTFKKVRPHDWAGVDPPPSITMGIKGIRRADTTGVRTVAHELAWWVNVVCRVRVMYDPANSVKNDTEVWSAVAVLCDTIGQDPTLGDLVDASGVTDVGEPVLLENARGQVVAQAVDVLVSVKLSGPWQQ